MGHTVWPQSSFYYGFRHTTSFDRALESRVTFESDCFKCQGFFYEFRFQIWAENELNGNNEKSCSWSRKVSHKIPRQPIFQFYSTWNFTSCTMRWRFTVLWICDSNSKANLWDLKTKKWRVEPEPKMQQSKHFSLLCDFLSFAFKRD